MTHTTQPVLESGTIRQAIASVKRGDLVTCTKEEWPELRVEVLAFASRMVDAEQHVYAKIALNEVKRLDARFEYKLLEVEGEDNHRRDAQSGA